MADISLIQDDPLDDCDEGVFEQGDGPSSEQVDDESVSPLAQFQKYALSENVFARQMVPRVLKELFKSGPAESLSNELPEIMNLFSKLAEEDETMVRTYIFEQVPNLVLVALDCSEQIPELNNILCEYLLPLIVRNLGDGDNQVRKTAQSTLFVLIENGLLTREQVELQVCPTVLALSNVESLMDYHTGTVTLMSKLAPFLGSEVTERMFLMRFTELCSNDMFYVRKVCASHFGDFCAVVSKEAYEQTLLPCYLTLCNDNIWGVRKACAEVATSVSCSCPSVKRHSVLAPVFGKLLQDQSRWVRMSAFQTLGPFISTFAEPTISTLAYNSSGELVVVNPDGIEFRINPAYSESNLLSSELYQFQERFNQLEDEQDNYAKNDNNEDMHLFYNTTDPINMKLDDATGELVFDGYSAGDATTSDQVVREPNEENTITEDSMSYDKVVAKESALSEDFNSSDTNENIICTNRFTSICTLDNSSDENIESPGASGDSNCDDVSILQMAVLNTKSITSASNSDDRSKTNLSDSSSTSFKNQVTSNRDPARANICLPKNLHSCSRNSNKEYSIEAGNDNVSEAYNSFNYWYITPEMPLDNEIVGCRLNSSTLVEGKPQQHFIVMEHCNALPSSSFSSTVVKLESKELLKKEMVKPSCDLKQCDNKEIANTEPRQEIVPQLLIDHFISMTDPFLADNTGKLLPYHCAYSLPAVALTLGRNNWHLLKNTINSLAANIHYKVRRTVASSLHELAIILGMDLASSNLTPIFDELIKDLDEVRIGVLKHLAQFLELIGQSKRNVYLPRFAEFLPAKNMSCVNWRFRKELAEQLFEAVPLFRPLDVSKHIGNVAQELLCDKVADVRESALTLMTELITYVSKERKLTSHLLVKLAEKFAHSTNWKRRQTFCLLCTNLLMLNALDLEQFVSDVMPHLLDLSWDPVANVRLVVGRTIAQQIATNGYFFDINSQHYDSIHSVLRRLQSDKDRDVRQSALIIKPIAVF